MGATQPHQLSDWQRAGRYALCVCVFACVCVCVSVLQCACERALTASVPRVYCRTSILSVFRARVPLCGRACVWLVAKAGGDAVCYSDLGHRISHFRFVVYFVIANNSYVFDGLARFVQCRFISSAQPPRSPRRCMPTRPVQTFVGTCFCGLQPSITLANGLHRRFRERTARSDLPSLGQQAETVSTDKSCRDEWIDALRMVPADHLHPISYPGRWICAR